MNITAKDLAAIRAIVQEELAAAFACAGVLQRPAAAIADDKFCRNLPALVDATGLPERMLQAIKRASRGLPDNPFHGHGAFPSQIRAWLTSRPDFAPSLR